MNTRATKSLKAILIPTGALLLAATAAWGAGQTSMPAAPPKAQMAQPLPPGVRGELQSALDSAEKELVALASAIPADKFNWRPAAGVRSIGEVCLHVAGGNYEVGAAWGLKPPAGVDLAKIEAQGADKGNAVAAMRVSFQQVRESIAALSDAELDRQVDFFGHPATVRRAIIAAATHAHEHLGQLIAYARMNKIAPPWSQPAPPAGGHH